MTLGEATEAYQAMLEATRSPLNTEPDQYDLLCEDLAKARRAMEIAWLDHIGVR